MSTVIDAIDEFISWIFIQAIMNCLEGCSVIVYGLFGEIVDEVGKTPQQFNPSVFSTVQGISETVILPIGGVVLTFVMCYELISMIIDKNNFHDFPPSEIMKWIFKTCIAILLITNVFTFCNAVFELAQKILNDSMRYVSIDPDFVIFDDRTALQTILESIALGDLVIMFLQSFVLLMLLNVMNVLVGVIIYGRMIEIYLVSSVAPIPFSTLGSKEQSSIGQNYIKSIIALGLQGFFIMLCVAIYSVMIVGIDTSIDPANPLNAMWECLIYNVMLMVALFKSGSLAKSIMSAH
ncbi:MAG: CD0415/CD1112 family protein [Eubacteriales bacterium]